MLTTCLALFRLKANGDNLDNSGINAGLRNCIYISDSAVYLRKKKPVTLLDFKSKIPRWRSTFD